MQKFKDWRDNAIQTARDYQVSKNGVRFLYNLNNNPPFVQAVTPQGDVYVMDFDGTTFLHAHGVAVLIQGCPFPDQVGATAEFRLFMHHNRRRIPAVVTAVFLIVLIQFLLTQFVPASYALLRWVLPVIASGVSILLAVYGLVVGVILLAKFFGPATIEVIHDLAPVWAGGRSATAPNSEVVRTSSSGVAYNPYNGGLFRVGQDLLLVSVPGETGVDFEDRLLCAKRQAEKENVYLWIIPYQSAYMQVLYSEADALGITGHLPPSSDFIGKAFHRDLDDDAPFSANIVRKGAAYTYEPKADYKTYIDAVCPAIVVWSQGQKMKYQNPTVVMLNTQKAVSPAINCILILCLSLLGLTAQAQSNMDAAKEFFGKTAQDLAPIGPIAFYFETLELDGNGDGRKTFIQVLKDCPGYKNTDNGRLQFVYTGEDQVIPEQSASVSSKRLEQAEQPAAQPSAPQTRHTGFWDRVLPLDKIPGYRKAIDSGIIDAGNEIEPRRKFLSYAFYLVVLPFMAGLFFLAQFGAKTCFREMQSGHGFDIVSYKKFARWGGWCRIACFTIIIFTAVCWIVNGMISDFFTGGYMIYVWMGLTWGKCYLTYQGCQKAIPNPPQTGQPYEDIITDGGAAAPRHLRPGGR